MTSTHGSHTSHSSSGSHSNTISVANVNNVSGTSSVTYESPYFGTLRSDKFNEGGLTSLVNAVEEIRASMLAPNSKVTVTIPSTPNATTITNLLKSTNGAAYRWNSALVGHCSAHANHTVSAGDYTNAPETYSQTVDASKDISEGTAGTSGHLNSTLQHPTINTWAINQSNQVSTFSRNDTPSISGMSANYLATTTARDAIVDFIKEKKVLSTSNTSHSNSLGISGASKLSHSSHSSCKRSTKDNIINFEESALDIIKNTNIVSFNYKAEFGDPEITHVGFIADDTDEILSTKYHDRMDYVNCIGILLKAVQELQKEIEELKK